MEQAAFQATTTTTSCPIGRSMQLSFFTHLTKASLTMPANRHKDLLLKSLIAAIALFGLWRFAVLYATATHYAFDLPYVDDWQILDFTDPHLAAGKPTLGWLFEPHGEHLVPFARLLFYFYYKVTGLDFAALGHVRVLAFGALLLVIFVVIARRLKLTLGERAAVLAFFPLFLHSVYGDVLSNQKLNFVNSVPLLTLVMVGFLSFDRAPVAAPIAACLLLLVGAFNNASGIALMLGVMGASVLVWLKSRGSPASSNAMSTRSTLYLVVGGLLIILAYTSLVLLQDHYLVEGMNHRHEALALPTDPRFWKQILKIYAAGFGYLDGGVSAMTWVTYAAGLVGALVMLAPAAIVAFQRHAQERMGQDKFFIAAMCLSSLSYAAVNAIGRANYGVDTRYWMYVLFPLPFAVAGWLQLLRGSRLLMGIYPAILVFTFFGQLVNTQNMTLDRGHWNYDAMLRGNFLLLQQQVPCIEGYLRRVTDSGKRVPTDADWKTPLMCRGTFWGPINEKLKGYYEHKVYFVRQMLEQMQLGGGSMVPTGGVGNRVILPVKEEPSRVIGFIDGIDLSTPGRLNVSGWAADKVLGRPVPLVVIATDTAVIGIATPKLARPDVAAAQHRPGFLDSGFKIRLTGATLPRDPHDIRVYGVTDDMALAELPR